jgi:predicted phosphodiesterase
MNIQLLSDVHLEFGENSYPELDDGLDLLILAGDIGLPHLDRYHAFLQRCSQNVKNVILITGNHEYYYSRGYEKIEPKIREFLISEKLDNIHFLQREYIDLSFGSSKIRILGCTLWTHIPHQHAYKVEEYMSDYYRIKTKIQKDNGWKKISINYHQVNHWFQQSQEWLNEMVSISPYPVIIVTHHTPLLHVKDENDFLSYGYHSDQRQLLQNEKIKLWCHGHSHQAHFTKINDVSVWANPVGYPKEYTGYKSGMILKMELNGESNIIEIENEESDEGSNDDSEESESFHESDYE